MSTFTTFAGTLSLLPVLLAAAEGHAQTCQPENIPATAPASRFTVHGDGTVTDRGTGLMWKRCAEGQSGSDCSGGSAALYTWQEALNRVQTVNRNGGFAGHADWRLPNIKELRSIVERQCDDPAIDLSVFPNTPSIGWSSSPVAYFGNAAWNVDFDSGHDGWYGEDGNGGVRLVRGGQ